MTFPAPRRPKTHDPDLERAMPAEAARGSSRPGSGSNALVRLRDGTWLNMTVLGWRKDTAGRWCMLLRWHDTGVTTLEAWFIYDPARIHAADGLAAPELGMGGRALQGSSAPRCAY
jgi:hypothetical protein